MEPSSSAEILAILNSIKEGFFHLLPKLVVALVVLLVGWLVAWLLRTLLRRLVARFSKQIAAATTADAWQQALADKGLGRIVSSSIYWLVLLVAITVASEAVGLSVLTTYLAALAHYLPRVIAAVAVLFVGVIGGRLVSNAAARLLPHQGRQLARLVRGVIVGAAVLVAIKQLGVDVSLLTNIFLVALAALLAGAAFAFGLGARSVIANILAMHYVNKSYDVGQRIRLGSDNGRIVRTTSTTVFIEHDEGELGIPGQQFLGQRCLRLSKGAASES